MSEVKNVYDTAKAIEKSICDRAASDGLFAIAFALLLVRNEIEDVASQLYSVTTAIEGMGDRE